MKRYAIAAMLAASALCAAAYDLAGTGFSPAGERVEDGRTFAVLDDGSGGELLFCAEADPDARRFDELRVLYEAVKSWPGLEAPTVRAINYAERLQVVAIPSRLAVEGEDLAPALPSGIQLFRSGAAAAATEYDFKVKSGKNVIRVRSVYTGWEELSQAALSAYRDPAAFVQARDPIYSLRRFADLDGQVAEVDGKVAGLATELAALDELVAGSAARADELDAQARTGNKTLAERLAGLEEALAAEKASSEALAARLAAAEAAAADAKAAASSAAGARDAAIMAALCGGKAPDEKAVAKLVELKAADPALDKAKGAPAALKAAGLALSAKEIAAVYLVKFGEK